MRSVLRRYELTFCVTAVGVSVSQMSLTSVLMPPVALTLASVRSKPSCQFKTRTKVGTRDTITKAGTRIQTASKQTGVCTKDIAELVIGSGIGIPGGSTIG
jgi:hypothetical protein